MRVIQTMISATKKCGFTLIELILVALLIGILVALSTPQLKNSFDNRLVEDSAKKLRDYLLLIQQHAITKEEIIDFARDPEQTNRFLASINGVATQIRPLNLPKELILQIVQEDEKIQFFPDGEISQASITLISPRNNQKTLSTESVYAGVKIEE